MKQVRGWWSAGRWCLVAGVVAVGLVSALSCGGITTAGAPEGNGPDAGNPPPDTGPPAAGLLQPADMNYLGAFRLPGPSGGSDWSYSGDAMTYFPDGDPDGPNDGFPGSIFGIGHDWHKQVSEITVPVPIASRDLAALNTAKTLRPFTDVRTGVGQLDLLTEILRVGMAYLPAQGDQTRGKLYLCFGQHFQEEQERVASHLWCEIDLTGARGAWWVGDYSPYSVNDYMFEIPASWADTYVGGRRLATGRFRDGGWGGQGPALFAIAPWQQGNPPADGTRLDAVPLLLYSSTATDEEPYHTLDEYHHSDEWSGGSWLTADGRAAVVFVGTKGIGECWYGLPDGTVWEEPYPDDPLGQRGWWSSQFVGRMLFYDPADLAAVAQGEKQPWEPQPYATMDLDQYLYGVTGAQQKHHVAACCFDRERGYFYMFEPLVDNDRSVVHVWKVG